MSSVKKCSLAPDIRELNRARQSALRFMVQHHVDEETKSSVELSLYEVLINVVDHAGEKFHTDPITLRCEINESTITLDISYHGEEFDLTSVPLPDIEDHFREGKRRGLGIYIIRTLMDSVSYRRENGLNIVTLVKKFRKE